MTIEEAYQKRGLLAEMIRTGIADFERKTGMAIQSVDLTRCTALDANGKELEISTYLGVELVCRMRRL